LGGNGGGGAGEPVGGRGCEAALIGTNGPDTLRGGDDHEIIVGFGAGDRMLGRNGHDCLIGGTGGDRLVGGDGSDRLTGGTGRDVLIDTRGFNAYDAGSGNDYVNARNGVRELVRCGAGRDRARADRRDRVRSCERLSPTR
jgi:Ca2+-binding RTX toxin-like protein